jgi:hypothetical protein
MPSICPGHAPDGRYDVHEAIDDIGREVNMSDAEVLIPPPALVREKLARSVREAKLLRSLLRVSVLAAEERHRGEQQKRPTSAATIAGTAR